MGSVCRQIARRAARELKRDLPQSAVFSRNVLSSCNFDVMAAAEDLFAQVVRLSRELREPDLAQLMAYLKSERRGYSAKVDGPSPLMQLVDNIAALEAECSEPDTIPAPPIESAAE